MPTLGIGHIHRQICECLPALGKYVLHPKYDQQSSPMHLLDRNDGLMQEVVQGSNKASIEGHLAIT